MTWHHHRIWIVAVLLLTGIALLWLIYKTPVAPAPIEEQVVATTSPDLTGRAIYSSGEYGFVVSYPETALVEDTFATTYHLASDWRVNALAAGDPIVAIIAYSTVSDSSYPRYYHAMVRIGASRDAKEVEACEQVTPNRGEAVLANVTIGDTTWKAFSFGDAGMQKYVRGVSYRTVHDGTCYAIEKIAAGSNYREDPDSPEDIADSVLDARYEGLSQIVESFSFAR